MPEAEAPLVEGPGEVFSHLYSDCDVSAVEVYE